MAIKPDQPDENSLWNSEEPIADFADYIESECEKQREAGLWAAGPIYDLLLHIEAVTPEWIDRILKKRDLKLHAQGDAIVGPPYETDPRT